MTTLNTPTVFDVEKVRADFPLLRTEMNGRPLAYLDNAASTQKPQIVIDSLREYYEEYNCNVHRGVYQMSQKATDAYERTRTEIAEFVNAKSSHEIIFTSGTTGSINLVANSFGSLLKAGDEILISGLEHHSNIVPWQLIAQKSGAVLRVIPVDDNGDWQITKVDELLTDKTRIVAVNHISNAIGTVNPIKEIIAKAHALGAAVLIDGAQSIQHEAIDVQELDCDFYCFSGHKIYGPTGTGVLFGKENQLDQMPPFMAGGDMIKTVNFNETTFNDLPYKFEAGTPNIAGVVGLGAAIRYFRNLDFSALKQHEQALLAYATNKLRQIDDLKIIGTANKKASVISFIIEGLHHYDIGTILDKLGIAVRTGHHCAQPLMDHFDITGTCRASFSFYNTFEEADRLHNGIAKAKKMLA